jgi:hypothetical protein
MSSWRATICKTFNRNHREKKSKVVIHSNFIQEVATMFKCRFSISYLDTFWYSSQYLQKISAICHNHFFRKHFQLTVYIFPLVDEHCLMVSYYQQATFVWVSKFFRGSFTVKYKRILNRKFSLLRERILWNILTLKIIMINVEIEVVSTLAAKLAGVASHCVFQGS